MNLGAISAKSQKRKKPPGGYDADGGYGGADSENSG